MTKKTPIQLRLDPNKPEGDLKSLGGGKADEWNNRLSNLTIGALPIAYSKNMQSVTEAFLAAQAPALARLVRGRGPGRFLPREILPGEGRNILLEPIRHCLLFLEDLLANPGGLLVS